MGKTVVIRCCICGARIAWQGRGRHPLYCSRGCRELAAFARGYTGIPFLGRDQVDRRAHTGR